jgi:methylated-DNA-[protein]-cysteine S-methyltransferase
MVQLYSSIYKSPVGNLNIQSTDKSITSITYIDSHETFASTENMPQIMHQCIKQFDEYFKGVRKSFDLQLQQNGTIFQQNVWQHLASIPFGKTISYLHLSVQIGDAKAVRAVAAANGRNKIAIVVPCHRVIGSNRTLTGYAGGLWRKQWLLEHEAKFHCGVQQLNF